MDNRNKVWFTVATKPGVIRKDQGCIDLPIGHSQPGCSARRIIDPDGKPAATHFMVIKRYANATLVGLRLETGHTHQIPVHMSHLGHPVYGDPICVQESPLIDRQALHGSWTSFLQPRTLTPLQFEVPLPEDMVNLLERLA